MLTQLGDHGGTFGPQEYLHPLHYLISAAVLGRPVDGFGLSDGLMLASRAAPRGPSHRRSRAQPAVLLPHWHQGRVALIGDAAWCLILYSGMGASAGIVGAEMLGIQKQATAPTPLRGPD
ncbi:hypothetical protein [Nonomuraea sp. NPDC049750]|uniref:hypothetical protein n=1 Tax=Nonomuraea sp. NPDC049750 TaxID=3154738 RepID=UPI003408F0AA